MSDRTDTKLRMRLIASNDQLATHIRERLDNMTGAELAQVNACIGVRAGISATLNDAPGLLILEMAQLTLSQHLAAKESTDAA